jgi:hypothetical protein
MHDAVYINEVTLYLQREQALSETVLAIIAKW